MTPEGPLRYFLSAHILWLSPAPVTRLLGLGEGTEAWPAAKAMVLCPRACFAVPACVPTCVPEGLTPRPRRHVGGMSCLSGLWAESGPLSAYVGALHGASLQVWLVKRKPCQSTGVPADHYHLVEREDGDTDIRPRTPPEMRQRWSAATHRTTKGASPTGGCRGPARWTPRPPAWEAAPLCSGAVCGAGTAQDTNAVSQPKHEHLWTRGARLLRQRQG